MSQKEKLPNLRCAQIGHDSEFFLWDTLRGEVVPSFKYYKPQAQAKALRPSYQPLKKKYAQHLPKGFRAYGQNVHTEYVVNRNCSGGKANIYRDGLAVEVGVDPVTCRAYMWNDTRLAMLLGEPARLPKRVVFTTKPWVPVSEKLMSTFPEDLRVLGCSPSKDAYRQSEKVVQVDPLKTFYRTCGSHLHMSFAGYETKFGDRPVPEVVWSPFIKLADLLLGVPFTLVFGDELEAKRRKLYGQAGEFRNQPYGGLEYRVLSSRLWNHQATYSLFLGIWKYILGGQTPYLWQHYDEAWSDDIQQAINEADPAKCAALMPLWHKLMATTDHTYTVGSTVVRNYAEVFPKLREMNLRGLFPDAGVWSRPLAPDAHQGWTEYSNYRWKLPTADPKELKDDYGQAAAPSN
jgi:hypothetical protein